MTDRGKPGGDYRPIACSRYDEYEIAIMHRRRLRLAWHDDNVLYDQVVTPVDLETRGGEEFLIARTADDAVMSIRLDKIRKVTSL